MEPSFLPIATIGTSCNLATVTAAALEAAAVRLLLRENRSIGCFHGRSLYITLRLKNRLYSMRTAKSSETIVLGPQELSRPI